RSPFEEQRDDLRSREQHRLQELDMAQQSLASDQQSLESMMQNMQNALDQEGTEQLSQSMQSSAMRQALGMLQRMMRGQPGQGQQAQMHMPGMSRSFMGMMRGPGLGHGAFGGRLEELDPATRSV